MDLHQALAAMEDMEKRHGEEKEALKRHYEEELEKFKQEYMRGIRSTSTSVEENNQAAAAATESVTNKGEPALESMTYDRLHWLSKNGTRAFLGDLLHAAQRNGYQHPLREIIAMAKQVVNPGPAPIVIPEEALTRLDQTIEARRVLNERHRQRGDDPAAYHRHHNFIETLKNVREMLQSDTTEQVR